MIIEDIKLVPAGRYLFVQVHTVADIIGLGEIGGRGAFWTRPLER